MAFIKAEAVMRRISSSGHKDDSWKNPGQLIIYLPHTLSITHTSFHIYVHHSCITTCHYLFGEGLSAILLHHGPSICDCQIDSIADGQTAQLVEQLTGARFKSSSGRSINTCVFLPSCYIPIHFDYLT